MPRCAWENYAELGIYCTVCLKTTVSQTIHILQFFLTNSKTILSSTTCTFTRCAFWVMGFREYSALENFLIEGPAIGCGIGTGSRFSWFSWNEKWLLSVSLKIHPVLQCWILLSIKSYPSFTSRFHFSSLSSPGINFRTYHCNTRVNSSLPKISNIRPKSKYRCISCFPFCDLPFWPIGMQVSFFIPRLEILNVLECG